MKFHFFSMLTVYLIVSGNFNIIHASDPSESLPVDNPRATKDTTRGEQRSVTLTKPNSSIAKFLARKGIHVKPREEDTFDGRVASLTSPGDTADFHKKIRQAREQELPMLKQAPTQNGDSILETLENHMCKPTMEGTENVGKNKTVTFSSDTDDWRDQSRVPTRRTNKIEYSPEKNEDI